MGPEDYLLGLDRLPESGVHPKAQVVRNYYYGMVRAGKKNKLTIFVVREQESVPEDAIEIRLTAATYKEVFSLAQSLLDEYAAALVVEAERLANIPPPAADAGDVVYFSDGDGTHTAIFLAEVGTDSFVLFLTTNPHWNPLCRPITREEMAFTGMPARNSRNTYLAPVFRPTHLMTRSGRSLPSHRTAGLLEEFDREEAKKY